MNAATKSKIPKIHFKKKNELISRCGKTTEAWKLRTTDDETKTNCSHCLRLLKQDKETA